MAETPTHRIVIVGGGFGGFVIGDLAAFAQAEGPYLPGVAPVAIQQGEYVARVIRCRLEGLAPPTKFQYRDLGMMATIGRAAAVVDQHWIRFAGWFAWLFVHILLIVEFENRYPCRASSP